MIKIGILTVSDRCFRGERADESGKIIKEAFSGQNYQIAHYEIVPDEQNFIAERLRLWADSDSVDLIITTGGTGLAPRDVTPEATRQVIEKEAPGIAEAIRLEGLKATPRACLSRATAGTRRKTLIVNLPGHPSAVRDGLRVILSILPHAIELLKGKPHLHNCRAGLPCPAEPKEKG